MPNPISHYGLTVFPPPGWEAVIYRRTPGQGESTSPVVHAANFALPSVAGDYGSGAVDVMVPGDAFWCLLEFQGNSAGQALFARNRRPAGLVVPDFGSRSLQRALPGQVGAQRFFAERGRAFCIYVVIAGLAQAAAVLPAVNQLIKTLQIAPTRG